MMRGDRVDQGGVPGTLARALDVLRGSDGDAVGSAAWRSRLVVGLGLFAGGIAPLLVVARTAVLGGVDRIGWLVLSASAALLAIPLVERLRPGGPAGGLFILVPTVTLIGMAALEQGVDSEAVLWMPLLPPAAVALVGIRGAILVAGVLVVSLVALYGVHWSGGFPLAPLSPHVAVKTATALGGVFFGLALGLIYELTRRRHLASLLAAEARNRALLDAMPDAVLRLGVAGEILDAVPSREVRGFEDASTLVDRSIDEVLGAMCAAPVREHLEQALASGRGRTLTLDFPGSSGTTVLELRSIPLADGTCLTIVRDMTGAASTRD